jgi:DNA polymerase III sliding clamp (beta) subunit (PCNA family)
VTLPRRKLYEVVRALPDGDVNIETDKGGTTVRVSGGQFSSKMPTTAARGFSKPAGSRRRREGHINGKSLAQMVAKPVCDTGEDTRFYLNGAQFVLKPEDMTSWPPMVIVSPW